MKLEKRKASVCQAQQKSGYTKMATVVEQGEKAAIQTSQWSDTEHHIQEYEGARPQSANQQCLRSCTRVPPSPNTDECCEVQHEQRKKGDVVHLFLPVPTDCGILDAHGSFSTLAVSDTV